MHVRLPGISGVVKRAKNVALRVDHAQLICLNKTVGRGQSLEFGDTHGPMHGPMFLSIDSLHKTSIKY